jgi:hypothetical protein
MLIYNVTTKVSWPIHEAWLQWMQGVHIPEVMATGCFEKFQMVRLLEIVEDEGPSYAIQYYSGSRDVYEKYLREFAPALRQKTTEAWGDQFIAFRTLMEVVG